MVSIAKGKHEKPGNFPAGNAKVGDRGTIRLRKGRPWRLMTVIAVGLTDQNGHYLNIRIRLDTGPTKGRVMTISCFGTDQNPLVIFPPVKELPLEVRDWAQSKVIVVRYQGNQDDNCYSFVVWDGTKSEYVEVQLRLFSIEFASLCWKDECFQSGKPDLEDSGTEVIAGDQVYQCPEDLEHYC